MIHQLKIEKKYFVDIKTFKKFFEIRNNDRNFKVGDYVGLNEIDEDGEPTGKSMLVRISYLLSDNKFLKDGYVIFSFEPCYVNVRCVGDAYEIL